MKLLPGLLAANESAHYASQHEGHLSENTSRPQARIRQALGVAKTVQCGEATTPRFERLPSFTAGSKPGAKHTLGPCLLLVSDDHTRASALVNAQDFLRCGIALRLRALVLRKDACCDKHMSQSAAESALSAAADPELSALINSLPTDLHAVLDRMLYELPITNLEDNWLTRMASLKGLSREHVIAVLERWREEMNARKRLT